MMHRNGGTSSWLNISRKQHTTNKQHRNKRRVHIPHTIIIMVSTFIDTCKTVYKVYVLCLYIINTKFTYYYARMGRCCSFLPFESSFILKCIHCYVWLFVNWHNVSISSMFFVFVSHMYLLLYLTFSLLAYYIY